MEKVLTGAYIGRLPLGYINDYMDKNAHKQKTYHFINHLNNLSDEECCELIDILNKKFPSYAFTKQQKEHITIIATCIE